jgi:hypothetical protein
MRRDKETITLSDCRGLPMPMPMAAVARLHVAALRGALNMDVARSHEAFVTGSPTALFACPGYLSMSVNLCRALAGNP